MGDGLHLALIQLEGGLQQCFAVARGAGPGNAGVLWQLLPDFLDGADGRGDGRAVIIRIELVQQLSGVGNQCQLGGGGAGVDAEEDIPMAVGKLSCCHLILAVPL